MVMKFVNWALRRQSADLDNPRCPSHDVQMRLRGVIGGQRDSLATEKPIGTSTSARSTSATNGRDRPQRSQVPGGTDIPNARSMLVPGSLNSVPLAMQ